MRAKELIVTRYRTAGRPSVFRDSALLSGIEESRVKEDD